MNKAQLFLKSHSPMILTIIGSAGVIITSVLAVKATPKALELIEDTKKTSDEKLTKMDIVRVAWRPYVPAVISGASTILCIFGANYLNMQKQKNIMSAYILLDNAFKEYRNRVINEYGEEINDNFSKDLVIDQLKERDDMEDERLFFEFNSMRFFEASIHKVLEAECKAKIQFEKCEYLSLNDYYSYLGISPSSYGEAMGWSKYQMTTEEHVDELEFTYEQNVMSNGLVCYNIFTNVSPTMDHFCF